MTASEDIDATAGEYVLGTLDAGERIAVAARRQREPALDTAIGDWEILLAPLAGAVVPVTPPDRLLAAVKRRLGIDISAVSVATPARLPDGEGAIITVADAVEPTTVVDDRLVRRWRRRARLWESATFAIGTIAATLLLGIGLSPTAQRPASSGGNFVAVLQKDAASPAFLVSVDMDKRSLTVRAVAPDPHPDKSFQLWLVDDKNGTPKSLGVIGTGPFTVESSLAKFDRRMVEKATYAVSLEPLGGSPTSGPTGPVLWSGRLVQATP